jgi:hypothetical protein
MPKAKWLVIAKNEFRLQTVFIKDFRRILPVAAIFIIFAFQLVFAPSVLNMVVDGFMALFMGQAAVALMQILLFMISLYLFVFPITTALKDVRPGQVEIILSAPVMPRDLLVGEFVGKIPVYAFIIALFSGIFTTIIQPLGLDIAQIVIINIVFIISLLLSYWFGTLSAAILRSRIGKSAKGRDLGKSLGFILALPLVAAMYAIMGGLLDGLTNPETSAMVEQVLAIFPSSWGAEVIVSLAQNPGNLVASFSQGGLYLGGLLIFFVASLWFGGSIANRLYDLEPSSFGSSSVKADGLFYNAVQALSSSRLTVSLFKDYSRRLENLTRLAYIVGLIVVMKLFLMKPDDTVSAMMPLLMLSPMIAGFVASDATLRGKECLFIYRKVPSGIDKFIKAKLIQSLMVVVPITAVIALASIITLPGVTSYDILIQFTYSILLASVNMVYALGIFFWNPVFAENQNAQMINFQPLIFTTIISWILLRTTLRSFLPGIDHVTYELVLILVHIFFTTMVGISTMVMGRRKLSKME